MLDFLRIATREEKKSLVVYPKFIVRRSKDLMTRGGDFYAVWVEERGLWSTDEDDLIQMVDTEIDKYIKDNSARLDGYALKILYMHDSDSGSIDRWHKYCQRQSRENFSPLDEKLIFSNMETDRKDFATKRLNYPLEPTDITAYDKLISTLYDEEERHKIEWAIGACITGESKEIQKFMVLYGSHGTGKSTVLNIIQKLFDGYYCVFDARALGTVNNQFALEPFKTNPLIAIQHDGNLSKIEDNTRLNSLVSHEAMTINEKFKPTYPTRINAFLFIGTNSPVKITDAKSGIIRRLIDVTPSGRTLKSSEYRRVVKQIPFELGGIACHCRDVFLEDPDYYDDYVPINMMGATNDFYNFVTDYYSAFKNEDNITLNAAYERYKTYCDDARVPYPMSKRDFREELKNYFWDFEYRYKLEDGSFVQNYYRGFRTDKFEAPKPEKKKKKEELKLIDFNCTESLLDKVLSDNSAQYATDEGTPLKAWDMVKTTLKDLDTSKIHFVRTPENHIVIDFDIPDAEGNKCFEKNLEAASKWPPTYAELSKSGAGIHLHYIYTGDVNKLSRVYEDHIEIKVFTGKSSLRRKLTKCNDIPIATISSGLPLKGDNKVVNNDDINNEEHLRALIKKALNRQVHPNTKSNIDYIDMILNKAYNSGMAYDVTNMRSAVFEFGSNSTNNALYCIKVINNMKFKSEVEPEPVESVDDRIVFYDIEVFPNLFLVNWKIQGKDKPVVRMINPSPVEIEQLTRFRLVGFNNRRYDNHILYGRMMGYTNEQLFYLSQRIIDNDKDAFFGAAYNLSYTDIYDYSVKKQSLKKWEIELGIHHQELGLPWDQPVPEERWEEVAAYCDNDVIATEAVWDATQSDWVARQILADLAGSIVNDTTNSLTTKFIFGKNRNPQSEFKWRDLSQPVYDLDEETYEFLADAAPEMMSQTHGEAGSLLPYFPGYKFERGVSTYRGEVVGEGGRVYAEPGMYGNVALLDVASEHPHSAIAEVVFGVRFTKRFKEIVDGRVAIKHEAWDEVNQMLDGMLTPYIQKVLDGEITSDQLADALKIAINSVYGLTAAKFPNAFKDPRNIDNIVAKRGALFMMDLQYEVQQRGFIVAHIKTDSIKIPDATPEIIKFVIDFGKKYGYTFEHEATYDRMCLVNDAVYIAKGKDIEWCKEHYGYIPSKQKKYAGKWTATGTQFQVPYIFKTLFSKEDILFEDMCKDFQVKGALYLDMNEELPDITALEKEQEKLFRRISNPKLADIDMTEECRRIEELSQLIEAGHNYVFVGKVGQFCPILPGYGGGILYREQDGMYYAATGTKGYRWLESEVVKNLDKEKDIDRSYFDNMVNEAVADISQYGDFEWFASDSPYLGPPFDDGKPVYIAMPH